MRYRVKVESYVVVEARNVAQAKARAETGLRYAVSDAYRQTELFADGWHLYGWAAKKAERVAEDE